MADCSFGVNGVCGGPGHRRIPKPVPVYGAARQGGGGGGCTSCGGTTSDGVGSCNYQNAKPGGLTCPSDGTGGASPPSGGNTIVQPTCVTV